MLTMEGNVVEDNQDDVILEEMTLGLVATETVKP